MIRLGINIDHVATLRNARGGEHPCPVRAALIAMEAGADGITAHLREDRRHIRDRDIERLKNEVPLPLNMEMAATDEMLAIALKIKPNAVCIVPERRQEVTTEGGLNAHAMMKQLTPFTAKLNDAGIRVSLFIAPEKLQIDAAKTIKADIVELHTGHYANLYHSPPTLTLPLKGGGNVRSLKQELTNLYFSADYAHQNGLEVHAGHGLNFDNVLPIAALPYMQELNIGHFLMGEAMFTGLKDTIQKMRQIMNEASQDQTPQQVWGDE
jgi:pyridoxine 5-phosphate synthase